MNMKCFICKQKGHLARSCPEARKKPAWMVVLEDTGPVDEVEELDPWMRTVTARKESSEKTTNTGGPSYKVDVVVEGVKTRDFLRCPWYSRNSCLQLGGSRVGHM